MWQIVFAIHIIQKGDGYSRIRRRPGSGWRRRCISCWRPCRRGSRARPAPPPCSPTAGSSGGSPSTAAACTWTAAARKPSPHPPKIRLLARQSCPTHATPHHHVSKKSANAGQYRAMTTKRRNLTFARAASLRPPAVAAMGRGEMPERRKTASISLSSVRIGAGQIWGLGFRARGPLVPRRFGLRMRWEKRTEPWAR